MTDLLHTLPDFPTRTYTHLIPSLEKNLISTTDLVTLDPLEIAKRAQLPLLDVKRLSKHVLARLQNQLGVIDNGDEELRKYGDEQKPEETGKLSKSGGEIASQWSTISTLDVTFDSALGGGIPTGYITEIVGERFLPPLSYLTS